jgi:O-antigen ligase
MIAVVWRGRPAAVWALSALVFSIVPFFAVNHDAAAVLRSIVAGRTQLWSEAIQIIRDHPLQGIGIGRFDLAYAAYYASAANPTPLVPHAHNIYLQAVLDLGMLGGISYLALLVVGLATCIGVLRHSPDPSREPALAAGAGLLGFMVYGIFDTIAPGARGELVIWLLLGFSAAATHRHTSLRRSWRSLGDRARQSPRSAALPAQTTRSNAASCRAQKVDVAATDSR